MLAITSLRLLEGQKRDGSTVPVMVGRSVTGRIAPTIESKSVGLDIVQTFRPTVAAREVVRANERRVWDE